MALECELKYLDVDLEAMSRRLGELNGQCLGRYFESNLVFDYPDRALKKADILLRLREKQGKAILTVKRPPENAVPTELKVLEEIESAVDDFHTVKSALETVGFSVAFAYEKVREKWIFMECAICLDRVPFGKFIEIEGVEGKVQACATALGLDSTETTTKTYHALNIAYREQNGLEPDESFVFTEQEKMALNRELKKE